MPLEEIAGILNLDTGTVKAHLFRAMGKLREELRDLYTAGTDRNDAPKLIGSEGAQIREGKRGET